MTPLERVTRALAANLEEQAKKLGSVASDAGRYPVLDGCFDMQEAARAVLTAIREPSEAILNAMRDTVPVEGMEWDYVYSDAVEHWQAMIDAALAEGE